MHQHLSGALAGAGPLGCRKAFRRFFLEATYALTCELQFVTNREPWRGQGQSCCRKISLSGGAAESNAPPGLFLAEQLARILAQPVRIRALTD